MKLIANNLNLNKKAIYLLPIIFLLLSFSLRIIGQEIECDDDEEKCECVGVNYCCKGGLCRCLPKSYPKNRCGSTNIFSQYKDNESRLEAAYFVFVKGEDLTEENVTKNEDILRQNPELREDLKKGELKIGEDTITFTPLEKAKKIISENRISEQSETELRFRRRYELDGIDDAIEEYKKYLGTPNSTPVQSGFFLNFGKELMQKNRTADAIEVFSLNIETDKSPEAQAELSAAQLRLAEKLIDIGNKRKARKVLRNVINDKDAPQEIKIKANEQLTQIREQE